MLFKFSFGIRPHQVAKRIVWLLKQIRYTHSGKRIVFSIICSGGIPN